MSNSEQGSVSAVLSRFVCQLRPYCGLLALALLLDLLSIPVALLLPVPLKIAVDGLTGQQLTIWRWLFFLPETWKTWEFAPLAVAAGLLLATYVLQHVIGFANWLLRTYTGEKIILNFRSELFAHAQRLSLSFHDTKGASDSAYRIQFDAPAVRDLVLNGVLPLLNSVLMLAGMVYVILRIDREIALVALTVAPVLFLLSREYSKRMRQEWSDVRERDSLAMGVVQEVLSSVRVVKAFGQEGREQGRFVRHSGHYMRGQLRLSLLQASFYVLVGTMVATASSVVLFLGARHVRSGVLSVGSLLLLMSYVAKLYEPLSAASSKLVESQSAIISLGRTFALLDVSPEVEERPKARAVRKTQGGIEFRDVCFHYDPAKPVLDHVSFRIGPGTHVGIIGASGAGKSTILSLLMRMYDPASGSILLDGMDLRDIKLQSLRKQFAIVLQEPVLFSTTVADNIAYAKPDATLQEIVAAAHAARAHEFITALPKGYDSEVGQRGASLSGGERQRISLARAFLKNSPVVIMDEPTSALDSRTEEAVVDATRALMAERTTFVVAHRTSTLNHCDVVFNLEAGSLTLVADRRSHEYNPVVHTGGRVDRGSLMQPELVCANGVSD